nr:acetylcholine receptor subunit alpha-type acr-16 [Crassostrea gigas]
MGAKFIFMLSVLSSGLDLGKANAYTTGHTYPHLKKLYEKMLGNYDKRILPKCTNEPVNVTIQLAPREIVDITEPLEVAKFQLWVRLSWFDCNLVWNKSSYGNISTFTVPNKDIWIPDLTLLEDIDYTANMPNMKLFRAMVSSDGIVHFNFLTVVNIVCQMNLQYYPYDVQKCGFTFMSWVYTSSNLHIQPLSDFGDLANFSPNQEFIAAEVTAQSIRKDFPCCGGNFSQVIYTLKLKRRPAFFMATIVVPFFIITMISFAGFALPSISGEKITFHTTILLATVVFLLLVQDQFPSTSETFPKIAIYFSFSMILSCMSCVMSSIVMYIYYNDLSGKKMNKWIRKILIEWMGKIMLVNERNLPYSAKNTPEIIQTKPNVTQEELRKSRKSRKSLKILEEASHRITQSMKDVQFLNSLDREKNRAEHEENLPKLRMQQSHPYDQCEGNSIIEQDLDSSTRRMNDWELLAYTLDRFFTVFYVFMTVLNSLVFLIIMKSHEAAQ